MDNCSIIWRELFASYDVMIFAVALLVGYEVTTSC
jgi:hypothetical protein